MIKDETGERENKYASIDVFTFLLNISVSQYLSFFLFISLSLSRSIYLSIYLSFFLSFILSFFLHVLLSLYHFLFPLPLRLFFLSLYPVSSPFSFIQPIFIIGKRITDIKGYYFTLLDEKESLSITPILETLLARRSASGIAPVPQKVRLELVFSMSHSIYTQRKKWR